MPVETVPDQDGRVEVQVTAGGYGATLVVVPPVGGGHWPSVADGLRALKQAGVTFGINKELVATIIRSGPYGQALEVAQGKKPKPGTDARIIYSFDAEKRARPSERRNGTMDFHELGTVENVQKGQVLAVKVPASPGAAGVMVNGTVVSGTPGRDRPLTAGKNTVLVDGGTRLLSLGDGHPVLEAGGRVSVLPLFTVNGNLDFQTGNVDFVGTVEVRGDVSQGFVVKARGDISVRGSSAALLLEAGQDVLVDRGIQGRNRGRVSAVRDVRAGFVENADVSCGRHLRASSVLHSRVEAAGRVEVLTGKGMIAGGSIRAKEAVLARAIGSPLATPTEVQVGVLPQVRTDLGAATAELEACQREIAALEVQVWHLRGQVESAALTTDTRARLLGLVQRLHAAYQRREVLEAKMQELNLALEEDQEGLVAADLVYPGVRITVGAHTIQVSETRRHVRLHHGTPLE